MITIYSKKHALHAPKAELSGGRLIPIHETPKRAEMVLARIKEVKLGPVAAPAQYGLPAITRVHDPEFAEFLQSAHAKWRKAYGDEDALPSVWPGPGMRRKRPNRIGALFGYYCFDAATPLTAGSWQAAQLAADVAVTAHRQIVRGQRALFALCRPPGHHSGLDFYGGYCLFNNAAIAAQAFIDSGCARVAILDVDFHHGNGTQDIFYRRKDVLYCSLHGHPEDEYPYFAGFVDEIGEGEGSGFNANFPLRPGTAWDVYSEALGAATRKITGYGPDALVVSLGVDTFERDPISSFKLTSEDFLRLGEAIARLGAPTLFVMEGGYAVEEIGVNVVNVLTGFEQA
jgi:acetoin utilization deacetylase AcuC-like enzyme